MPTPTATTTMTSTMSPTPTGNVTGILALHSMGYCIDKFQVFEVFVERSEIMYHNNNIIMLSFND